MAYRGANRVKKTIICFIWPILLPALVAGCVGMRQRPAAGPPPPGAEAGLARADKARGALEVEMAAFQSDFHAAEAEVAKLRRRPHWSGFERILLAHPSLTDPNKQTRMTPRIKTDLVRWSRRSREPWEEFMRDYYRLTDRCAILEMRRVAARRMLISVQAAYMAVVMMEAGAGHGKKAEEIFSKVEALDKPAAQLDAIRLDRLGLYEGRGAGSGERGAGSKERVASSGERVAKSR